MKSGKKGLSRIISATRYSWQGLRAAWRHEAAFRQEAMLAELVNSAIEATIDRLGEEPDELSGRAKDMGSAVVFMAILIAGLSWCTLIINLLL